MNIGFDAKRAFYNKGGLGNYSRNSIFYFHKFTDGYNIHLYTPSLKNAVHFKVPDGVRVSTPSYLYPGFLKSYWRTKGILSQLQKDKIDIYHGLSNELPLNIHKSNIKSVVTIHDLIFLRYPHFYKDVDRWTYKKKFFYSSEVADVVVAVSQQTKNDLIEFYKVSPQKIKVIYQGCDPEYFNKKTAEELAQVRSNYNLPVNFILTVGTIEERKNLLSLLRTLNDKALDIPLVVVGQETEYTALAKQYIAHHNMTKQVIFLHQATNFELSCLYQMAFLSIYPSLFEGFGIPVIESLASGTPVITSKGTCLEEAGGKGALFVNPGSTEEIAGAIETLITNSELRTNLIEEGAKHVKKFHGEKLAKKLNKLYQSLV